MPRRPGPPSPAQLSTLAPPTIHLARSLLRHELREQLRAGRWVKVRPGAYMDAPAGADRHVSTRLGVLARAAAIHRQSRARQIFSHQTAAVLLGLPLVGVHGAAHVTRPTRPGSDLAQDIRVHVGQLEQQHVTQVEGIPVTTLERTAIDCSMSMARRHALVVGDAALHVGADLAECERLLEELAGRRGVAQARWVLAAADAGAESPAETSIRFDLLLAGLPRPATQVRVETDRGVYWANLGWPEQRVVVEYDGATKYEASGRASAAVIAEKHRQEAMEAAGWTVIRASAEDLRDPRPLLARIRAALSARAPR